MPTPKMKDRLPAKQSLRTRIVRNILADDDVRPFGSRGTTTTAYGLTKKDKPMGESPNDGDWGIQDASSSQRAKG